jgi:hypothetical protein
MSDRGSDGRKTKGRLEELIDRVGDAIRGVLDGLAPQPDAIPVPVRPDRRPGIRR